MQTQSKNTAPVERFFNEVINLHKPEVLDQLLSTDFVSHDYPKPHINNSRESLKDGMNAMIKAFPDINIKIEDMREAGNEVVTRGTWTGTQKADYMGITATNKKVNVHFIDIWKVEDGKLKENWVQMDTMELMQQLGKIPLS
ncbi:ester cyclase [Mucilaginibacter sp.]|uniref:ester cyclase n=1 Tax=Mucilaginibacter sp. TaxID=1882438 RepID=UPI00260ADE7C|nr:ester cyclase [Mucilaginibacter sp.]MDB5029359.1 hypothetical protein [Mucilaginibacter sp.]